MSQKICFRILLILFCLLPFLQTVSGQELPVDKIKKQINDYKNDIRGPYYRIKWFCKDGSVREARDPCPDDLGGGIQHASYKEEVTKMATQHHLFFGEILAGVDAQEFWDKENVNSRLKQYQLGKYLSSVDNGWILQKGQYYRGAVQSEDEEAWGINFYRWLLKDPKIVQSQYYLIRQSLRDIPHDGDNNLAQLIRSQSKIIADEMPSFMDARIKIHGKPDQSDIKLVREFEKKNSAKIVPKLRKEFDNLSKNLKEFYAPINSAALTQHIQKITQTTPLKVKLQDFVQLYDANTQDQIVITGIAEMLCTIREEILENSNPYDRLLILDLSNQLEDIFLRKIQEWEPESIKELIQKIYTLSYAATGTGLIELWEWEATKPILQPLLNNNNATIAELNDFLFTSRGIVEWSAAMVKANYQQIVDTYTTFEPLAYGFIDDRIRSAVTLNLGESVSQLGSILAKESSLTNAVMNLENQSAFRGLNPGYALGELVVVNGSPEAIEVVTNKIYVFKKPPSDLKPVAGIMTVSEGNLVSHVQLLARNLGIPNAALSDDDLKALEKYHGKQVFYAVSDKGTIIMKLDTAMTAEEKALFSKKARAKERITVPVDQIRLDQTAILDMGDVRSADSGKLCGPKAANLGQLKSMFPDHVVNGLVVPFGIFKMHMDEAMPTTAGSYWDFLNQTFAKAKKMKAEGQDAKAIEDYQLEELAKLKNAIKKITLKPSFVAELRNKFKRTFNGALGKVPVFLRSDTNMEDLKEFTGAGLNLTLFNILTEEKILEGIKDVWASPYTDRSFKWRQQYLRNPENVFPSILIIPSVDVEYSGVMITKGINIGKEEDLTVAFSRGAGGAVDGQSAETYLLAATGDQLLSPARQPDYLRLPTSGGTMTKAATFNQPILTASNMIAIKKMAKEIRETLPKRTKSDYSGAYDIELGFENDKLWLFQIRPFVENKRAKSSEYLNAIAPKVAYAKNINLTTKI